MKIKNIIFPLLVFLSASFLIFYQFPFIPQHLAFDEVEFAKLALSLEKTSYTPYSPLATGHSTLYFYILLASLKIFGINTFALRLPSAIFGVFSVLVFYFILKIIYKNNKVITPTFLLIIILIFLSSRWFLNFSRFSFEATFLLFLELTSIYFLLLAEKENTPMANFLRLGMSFNKIEKGTHLSQKNLPSSKLNIYLILSGIFTGLAYNSYTPGRIFFLLPLVFLVIFYLKNLKLKILYFLLPFIIITTPLNLYLLTNKDTRVDQLFFWKNHEMTVNQKITGTIENISSISQMFFLKGDLNGKHNYPGKPALNPFIFLLFFSGLLISLFNLKNPFNFLFLGYFFLSIFPSLAIYPWENPSMLRTFTTIPSTVYFISVTLYHLFSIVKRWYKNKLAFVKIIITIFIFISCCY